MNSTLPPVAAPRIVVVGSVNADIMIDVAALPLPHQTVAASGLRRTMGGKGLNQAVAAARMGAKVTMIAAVGDDADGHAALVHLESCAVDIACIATIPDAATGTAHILVARDGSNMIAVSAGANAALTPAHVLAAESAIATADLLLVQYETPLATVRSALTVARKHGTRTVLNPAPAGRELEDLLPLVDLITPNETELLVLTEGEVQTGGEVQTPAALQAALGLLVEKGAGTALVTLGVKGSMAIDGGQTVTQPIFPVAVVDSVGAGDVFNGALACAVASGQNLAQAMRIAAAASALSVTRSSADCAPLRDEVESLLSQ